MKAYKFTKCTVYIIFQWSQMSRRVVVLNSCSSDPLSPLNHWVCWCQQHLTSSSLFLRARLPAFKVFMTRGIVLIHFLRSRPGKKFVDSDRISFILVSGKLYYILNKPLSSKSLNSSLVKATNSLGLSSPFSLLL